MLPNEFVWCDLSTFDLPQAGRFYRNLFDWDQMSNGPDPSGDYEFFNVGRKPSAGIFAMPQFLQEIGMPSFWMSYVRVANLDDSLALAIKLGAKCEIKPTPFDASSRYALIRDPAGAGFTLYEGPDLQGRDIFGSHGRMVWNELHVPDLAQIADFYRKLFDWDIKRAPTHDTRYTVHSTSGSPVASIQELDESAKGPKNYWAVFFFVDDLDMIVRNAVATGGSAVYFSDADSGSFALLTDDQGAAFCVTDSIR